MPVGVKNLVLGLESLRSSRPCRVHNLKLRTHQDSREILAKLCDVQETLVQAPLWSRRQLVLRRRSHRGLREGGRAKIRSTCYLRASSKVPISPLPSFMLALTIFCLRRDASQSYFWGRSWMQRLRITNSRGVRGLVLSISEVRADFRVGHRCLGTLIDDLCAVLLVPHGNWGARLVTL